MIIKFSNVILIEIATNQCAVLDWKTKITKVLKENTEKYVHSFHIGTIFLNEKWDTSHQGKYWQSWHHEWKHNHAARNTQS